MQLNAFLNRVCSSQAIVDIKRFDYDLGSQGILLFCDEWRWGHTKGDPSRSAVLESITWTCSPYKAVEITIGERKFLWLCTSYWCQQQVQFDAWNQMRISASEGWTVGPTINVSLRDTPDLMQSSSRHRRWPESLWWYWTPYVQHAWVGKIPRVVVCQDPLVGRFLHVLAWNTLP